MANFCQMAIFLTIFQRGKNLFMAILGLFQKKIKGYDVVISYSHLFNHKYFANGSGDFVLDKTICQNKVCLIHCDYLNSGCVSNKNNKEYKGTQVGTDKTKDLIKS